jgi:hypothetical protein
LKIRDGKQQKESTLKYCTSWKNDSISQGSF